MTKYNSCHCRLSSFLINLWVNLLPPSLKLRRVNLLMLVPLLLTSCFEPKKACLDIEAANFDASADEDCCCIYPKLKLTVVQNYDTLTYKPDSAYVNDLGQQFRIRSIVFYLSDFQLIQNGATYTVSDTVSLRVFGPNPGDTMSHTFTDDFLLIRRENISNEVGSFSRTGLFSQVKFRLGLSDDAQDVVPGKAPSGHPLRPQGDSLWYGRNTGYVFAQIVVARDTVSSTPSDTLSFTQADLPNYFIAGINVFHETGYDFNLKLTANVKALFDGVDWSTGDINDWKMKIRDNFDSVFLVSQ